MGLFDRILGRATAARPAAPPARIDSPEDLMRAAHALEAEGRIADAAQLLFNEGRARWPELPAIYGEIGRLLTRAVVLHEAVGAYDAGLKLAPRDTGLMLGKARAQMYRDFHAESAATLEKAARIAPADAEVLAELAYAQSMAWQVPALAETAEKLGKLDPDSPRAAAYAALAAVLAGGRGGGMLARGLAQTKKGSPEHKLLKRLSDGMPTREAALEALERALAAAPYDFHVVRAVAAATGWAGQAETSARHYATAHELRPDDLTVTKRLGMFLARAGRMEEAWPYIHYAHLDRSNPNLCQHDIAREWDGKPRRGQHLVVYSDQGIGDDLLNFRYIPLLLEAGMKVTLVHKPILSGVFPALPGLTLTVAGDSLPAGDAYIQVNSLPRCFNTGLSTIPLNIPYLQADPARTAYWRQTLEADKGPLIGLCWRTQSKAIDVEARHIRPPRVMAPLADAAREIGARLVNLSIPVPSSLPVKGMLAPVPRDFADTLSLLSALDLTISVDTSVIHAAGALGLPFWLLLTALPDWRYPLSGDKMPWYPTARLYHQAEYHEWDEIMKQVAEDLRNWQRPSP